MGAAQSSGPSAGGIAIYPWFLLKELPPILSGLSIAGFFAIAQGSLDSAMNALAASIVADVYLPLRKRLRPAESPPTAKASKLTVAAVGLGMIAFACLCAAAFDPRHQGILDFVLGLMTFALSGMLGVFLTALLTTRGNSASVIAALMTGAATVLLLQNGILPWWTQRLFGHALTLAWPWWMPIATTASFLVCITGRPARPAISGFPIGTTSPQTPA
jgi:Na+/proline symporter